MSKNNLKKLSLIYDKRQKDFVVKYPKESCDAALLMNFLLNDIFEWDLKKTLNKEHCNYNISNFKKELEERGYDLSTLKFSIELKK